MEVMLYIIALNNFISLKAVACEIKATIKAHWAGHIPMKTKTSHVMKPLYRLAVSRLFQGVPKSKV